MKTDKGTVLPIGDIKGKPYLHVQWRLVWFREEHPEARIKTEIIQTSETHSIVKATIFNKDGNELATAHKSEHKAHFADHLEKCETGAIGRALAMCGYGTQFCADELDEGARIVDAPANVQRPSNVQNINSGVGSYVCKFGKFKGQAISDIPKDEIKSYVSWARKTPNLEGAALEFVEQAEKFLKAG